MKLTIERVANGFLIRKSISRKTGRVLRVSYGIDSSVS